MNLEDLKKPMEYKMREGPRGTQLAYIDARQVMDRLDEVVGMGNWQTDYKTLDGKIYCGIAIYVETLTGGNWVWKWDMGTESEYEAEKGEASDAFKRAGVRWGIGRFLYDIKPTTKTKPIKQKLAEMGIKHGTCDKCGDKKKISNAGKVYCPTCVKEYYDNKV